jgi:hypothetical protein
MTAWGGSSSLMGRQGSLFLSSLLSRQRLRSPPLLSLRLLLPLRLQQWWQPLRSPPPTLAPAPAATMTAMIVAMAPISPPTLAPAPAATTTVTMVATAPISPRTLAAAPCKVKLMQLIHTTPHHAGGRGAAWNSRGGPGRVDKHNGSKLRSLC